MEYISGIKKEGSKFTHMETLPQSIVKKKYNNAL